MVFLSTLPPYKGITWGSLHLLIRASRVHHVCYISYCLFLIINPFQETATNKKCSPSGADGDLARCLAEWEFEQESC